MYIYTENWDGLDRKAILKDNEVIFAFGNNKYNGQLEVWFSEKRVKEMVETINKTFEECKEVEP